jgi:hypothetical protein
MATKNAPKSVKAAKSVNGSNAQKSASKAKAEREGAEGFAPRLSLSRRQPETPRKGTGEFGYRENGNYDFCCRALHRLGVGKVHPAEKVVAQVRDLMGKSNSGARSPKRTRAAKRTTKTRRAGFSKTARCWRGSRPRVRITLDPFAPRASASSSTDGKAP